MPKPFTIQRKGNRSTILVADILGVNYFGVQKRGNALVLDPSRSKLGAGIALGIKEIPQKSDVVLYLGASAGQTVSFLAQWCNLIFAVEFAPVMARELVFLSELLPNVAPILGDAAHPERYAHRVSLVDYVFQDVSQRNQYDMFVKNCRMFLKKEGVGMISVKTRSIDVKKTPKEVCDDLLKKFKNEKDLKVLHSLSIHKFEKDHYLVVVQKV